MISITHPIKQMINSQHGFLSSMLDFYPHLMNELVEKQKKEVEELAKEVAGDDYEVYRDVLVTEICGCKTTLYGYKDDSDSMVPLKSW